MNEVKTKIKTQADINKVIIKIKIKLQAGIKVKNIEIMAAIINKVKDIIKIKAAMKVKHKIKTKEPQR
jgi:hypothetical protein